MSNYLKQGLIFIDDLLVFCKADVGALTSLESIFSICQYYSLIRKTPSYILIVHVLTRRNLGCL